MIERWSEYVCVHILLYKIMKLKKILPCHFLTIFVRFIYLLREQIRIYFDKRNALVELSLIHRVFGGTLFVDKSQVIISTFWWINRDNGRPTFAAVALKRGKQLKFSPFCGKWIREIVSAELTVFWRGQPQLDSGRDRVSS